MKTAIFLAMAVVLATSTGHPKVSLKCSDFEKLPDGTWRVVRTTIIVISNFENRTQYSFPASEGTRYPLDAEPTPPAKDDGLSGFMKEDMKGVDVVGELEEQCP